jgi:hypothetical protein
MTQRKEILGRAFDDLVRKTMEMWTVPGLAIGVIDNGAKEYKVYYCQAHATTPAK